MLVNVSSTKFLEHYFSGSYVSLSTDGQGEEATLIRAPGTHLKA